MGFAVIGDKIKKIIFVECHAFSEFNKRLRFLMAILLFICATDGVLHANPVVLKEAHFDAHSADISSSKSTYLIYRENGTLFNAPRQGQAEMPYLTTEVAMDGSRSLRLTIGPSARNQIENDRSEFTVVHQNDDNTLRLGQDRYLGFGIYFSDQNFSRPSGELIVCQIWQSYKKIPTGPPAFIAMNREGDDLSFRLATRSDASTKSQPVTLGRAAFVRGAWNSVVLHLVPRSINDPKGPGLIEMWLNGSYLGGSERPWGYSSANSIDAFDVRVGLYANPDPTAHTVWVDRIRWGTSKDVVDPGLNSTKPIVR